MSSPRKVISFGKEICEEEMRRCLDNSAGKQKAFCWSSFIGFCYYNYLSHVFKQGDFLHKASPEFKEREAHGYVFMLKRQGWLQVRNWTWLKALIWRILSLSLWSFLKSGQSLKHPRTTLLDDPKQKHFYKNTIWMYKRLYFSSL